MSTNDGIVCYEVYNKMQNWIEFNKITLVWIVLNNNYYYLFTNKLDLSGYFLRVWEWPWDIERGIKIIVYDDVNDKILSFRYKINYMDYCSQFVGIMVGGILLALILKRVGHCLNK